jgi:hypothetical protein
MQFDLRHLPFDGDAFDAGNVLGGLNDASDEHGFDQRAAADGYGFERIVST